MSAVKLLHLVIIKYFSCLVTDKRRRNYDMGGSGFAPNAGFTGMNGHSRRSGDFDFEFSSFKFRTPEEVFRGTYANLSARKYLV